MLLRIVARSLTVLCVSAVIHAQACAQSFPSRTIRILVGYAPGGATDIVARIYAQNLQTMLGATVIVDNRPGASQLIAMRELLAARPDGYTVSIATVSALTQTPAFRDGAGYDPVKDLTPIAMFATTPGVFVVDAKLPIKTLSDLTTYAKAHPDDLLYATAGVGSADYVQFEYYMHVSGTNMRSIPYKSAQEATLAVASGQANVAITTANFVLPLIEEGKLRAIAVSGMHRLKEFPDVPTLKEIGIPGLSNLTYLAFYGMVAPRGLDVSIVERLNAAINEISAKPDVRKQMTELLFMEMVSGTPGDFGKFLAEDLDQWRKLQKETGIRF